MKQITRFFISAAVMLAITVASYGQVTAQATATATIVTPITITTTSNMSFGNVIQTAPASTSTVVLAPAGTATYTNASTSVIPAATATISAAVYNVTGTPAATYSITIPGAPITLNGPSGTMTVDNFTSTPTVAAGGVLSSPGGTQVLRVGAQLNISANQAAGTYTSANFPVTVNYN
jgi:hypothetical protein